MLKVKKDKYLYAQIKIDGKPVDFYIGVLADIDCRKDANILDDKLRTYLANRDLTHEFTNQATVYGRFWFEVYNLKDKYCGASV